MARVNVVCTSCGFHFSVGEAQIAGACCPSCLAPLGNPGPRRKTARVLAPAPEPGALKMKLGIAAAGVLVLGIVAAVFLRSGSPEPSGKPTSHRPKPAPDPKPEPLQQPKNKPTVPPKPAPTPPVSPQPAPAPPEPPPIAPPSQPAAPPLPDELKALGQELLALKEWHQNLVAPAVERKRVHAVLTAGKGTSEDVEFLKALLNGPRLRVVKEEAMFIRDSRDRLEKEALEGLPVDRVSMIDGRILHGKILEEKDGVVNLERKFAGGGAVVMPLKRPEIKLVEQGKGIGGEFKTRWEEAKKGGPPALVGLLAWCRQNTLALQASLAAHAILVDDPGRAEARQEAGLSADPVARMLEAEKQGGFILYEGRRWLPSELRDKLLREGYALVDGKWMAPGKSRMIGAPGLFRNGNQGRVMITGNLVQDEVITYNVVQGVEKMDVKPVRRFYAAAPMTVTGVRRQLDPAVDVDQFLVEDKANPPAGSEMRGEVFITVPLDGPILEASVMTLAEVKAGASITVSLIVEGRRIPLYTCNAKEDGTHKLPEVIRGRSDVQLVAEFTGRAGYGQKTDKKRLKPVKRDTDRVLIKGVETTYKQLIPEYPAVLFPSHAHTIEVFRLTFTPAEPAPALDKLFESAREILKR